MPSSDAPHHSLITDGYCTIEGILDDALLHRLRQAVEPLVESNEVSADSQLGSLMSCQYEDDAFAELIARPRAQAMLRDGVRWQPVDVVYMIDKPPHTRAAVVAPGLVLPGRSDQSRRASGEDVLIVLPAGR